MMRLLSLLIRTAFVLPFVFVPAFAASMAPQIHGLDSVFFRVDAQQGLVALSDLERAKLQAAAEALPMSLVSCDIRLEKTVEIKLIDQEKAEEDDRLDRMMTVLRKRQGPDWDVRNVTWRSSTGAGVSRIRLRIGETRMREDIHRVGDSQSGSYAEDTIKLYCDSLSCAIQHQVIDDKIVGGTVNLGQGVCLSEQIKWFGLLNIRLRHDIQRSFRSTSMPEVSSLEQARAFDGALLIGDRDDLIEIRAVNPWTGQLKYVLYLDAHDWGQCDHVAYFDSGVSLVTKTVEFGHVEDLGKGRGGLPRKMIERTYRPDGTMKRIETIRILSIETEPLIKDTDALFIENVSDYHRIDNPEEEQTTIRIPGQILSESTKEKLRRLGVVRRL